MGGTILCGITDTPEGRAAAQLGSALGDRLGLRTVLVHAVDVHPAAGESLGARQRETGAKGVLREIAGELGLKDAELRVVVGDRAERIASIAAEEGADMIVLGSRTGGFRGRQLSCSLARQLEAETQTPIVIAPPQTQPRSDRRLAAADGAVAR